MRITDIGELAKFMLSPECQSIALLTGAGVSVASGIPDFRSPGGMYDTLRPERITATKRQRKLMEYDPTNVVTWDMFQQNQFPYMEVRRPFILGTHKDQWKATISHRFCELLQTKTDNKLTRIYTQNIDGLYQQCTDIPSEKIVNVHGTLSEVSCEGCGYQADFDEFCNLVETNIRDIYHPEKGPKESKPILCDQCQKPLVKPSTVLFGRNLPMEFFELSETDLPTVDLLLIAGTSLVVSPANSLVYRVPSNTKRVVINLDPVGEELGIVYNDNNANKATGKNKRDFFVQGECDSIFLDLIVELGWFNDLKAKMDQLPPKSVQLVQQRAMYLDKS